MQRARIELGSFLQCILLKLQTEMESERKTLTKEQTVKQRVCEVCEYEYVLL